jgi:hypothetical protein
MHRAASLPWCDQRLCNRTKCQPAPDPLASRNNTLVWMYALAFITFITILFVTFIHTLFLLSFLCLPLSLHSFSLFTLRDQIPRTTSQTYLLKTQCIVCHAHALLFEFLTL